MFEKVGPQSVEDQRSSTVTKVEVSKSEKTKTGLKQTTDSYAAHSIATLLDDWSTLSLNSAKLPGEDGGNDAGVGGPDTVADAGDGIS